MSDTLPLIVPEIIVIYACRENQEVVAKIVLRKLDQSIVGMECDLPPT